MATLFIDADACPVTRDAISVARSRGFDVVLVGNGTQNLAKHTGRAGVSAVEVSSGRDAADFAIIERLAAGDVVVTQDIGLAAMVLGRGARALGPRGRVFDRRTIDADLEVRHAEQRLRRAGGRHGGPSPFTEEDREHFRRALERVISEGAEVGDVRGHFDGEAAVYDELIRRLVPGYDGQHDVIAAELRERASDASSALDLGCGTGALAAIVLESCPDARVRGIDLSPAMISQASARLARFGDRFTGSVGDLRDTDLGLGFDLVVSGLAIHHLEHDEKRALFSRVFGALAPGGLFLQRDVLLGETDEEAAADDTAWRAFLARNGEDPEAWAARQHAEDRPARLSDQTEWLADAGFADISVLWRRGGFAIVVAERPR